MTKKILATILAAVLSVNLFCFGVYAETQDDMTKKEHTKLWLLLEANSNENYIGYGMPYDVGLTSDYWDIFANAEDTLYDKNATYDDYHKACEEILDLKFNRQYINYDYAYATYQNALNEENINGWYTDEEWSDFQDKIIKLKAALDAIGTDVTYPWKDEGKRQALTDAFHSLLRSYNTMTNRNAVIGDVDGNGKLDINDVTLIQKYLAEMCDLNGAQKMRAAVYANRTYEKLRVSDVTKLQLYLTELIDRPIDSWSYDYVFVSEVPLNPLINEDFLMERMFNFNICPRNDLICYDIENGFYSTQHFIRPMLEFPYDMSVFE